jgi:hypothetical protein
MTKAEERAKKYFESFSDPIAIHFGTSPQSCFMSGWAECEKTALEMLRSEEASNLGEYSVRPISAKGWSDWIENKLKE